MQNIKVQKLHIMDQGCWTITKPMTMTLVRYRFLLQPIGIWLRQSVTALNTTQKNTNNDRKVICYFSHQWLSLQPLQWMLDNAFNTIDLETKSKGPRVSGASRAWSRWSSPPQSPCPPFVGAPPTARRSPFQLTASLPQIPERIFYFWKLHSTMTGHTDKKCYGESSKKTDILLLGWS